MLGLAWRSLGWFLAGVAVALGFLLVPLQVAAERKKLDRTVADIVRAKRDIRALETEFDTRANLAQLDQWNNDTLRLVAPAPGQYVADEAALAAIDVHRASGEAGAQMASFVPSAPLSESMTQAAAATQMPVPAQASAQAPAQASAQPMAVRPAVVRSERIATAVTAEPRAVSTPRVRPQTVALLDRKLLSDTMIGDLRSGARAELGGVKGGGR